MEQSKQDKTQNDAQYWQLQELKSIGIIANNIVHDFNNVIGVIRGYADLALRATSADDRSRAYLTHVIEEADTAKELAEKLRIFSGQEKLDYKLIDIPSVAEQAIKIFRESVPTTIEFQQDIDTTCGAVLGDADQIQQAVINLFRNAYDALCDKGGILNLTVNEVDVGAEVYRGLDEGRYVKLTVSDTGCGMDQETLKRIFEPFFTTKKNREHAGLGLLVVDKIVKGHKGAVIAESKVGEGAKFDIYLPLPKEGQEEKEG